MKALEFAKSIRSDKTELPPFLVLSGDDAYLMGEACKALMERLDAESDLLEVDWTDQGDPEERLKEIFDEIRTGSLFGGRKVVRIRNADGLVKSQAKALSRFVTEPGEGILVLEGTGFLPKRRGGKPPAPILKIVEAGGVLIDCSSPGTGSRGGSAELAGWARELFREQGKTIEREALELLLRRSGGDAGVVNGHVQKLLLHAGDRDAISNRDVEDLVPDTSESTLFDVVDGFAERDFPKARAAYERVVRHGMEGKSGKKSFSRAEAALRLVALLANRLRELGRIMELRREGAGYEEAASAVLGAQRSWLARRMRPQFEARTPRELGEAVVDLGDLDHALKSGGGDPETLLMSYLVRHCRPRQRRSPSRMRVGVRAGGGAS